jgi:hypothetical protein
VAPTTASFIALNLGGKGRQAVLSRKVSFCQPLKTEPFVLNQTKHFKKRTVAGGPQRLLGFVITVV